MIDKLIININDETIAHFRINKGYVIYNIYIIKSGIFYYVKFQSSLENESTIISFTELSYAITKFYDFISDSKFDMKG